MARLQLELPEAFLFTTQMSVRVSDLNPASHLGNDAMISMLSEARARFFYHFGINEANIEGLGIVMTDLAATYLAEAFAFDQLRFEVGVVDFNKYGCDLIYRVSNALTGKMVAQAKTGIVSFDFSRRKIAPLPESFRKVFPQVGAP